MGLWDTVTDYLGNISDTVKKWVKKALKTVKNNITDRFSEIRSWTLYWTHKNYYWQKVTVSDWVNNVASNMLSDAKSFVWSKYSAAKSYADGILSDAKNYADGVLSSAKNYADGVLSSAKNYADGVLSDAEDYVDNAIPSFIDVLQWIVEKIVVPFNNAGNNAQSTFDSMVQEEKNKKLSLS